jgi:hypothetical protein
MQNWLDKMKCPQSDNVYDKSKAVIVSRGHLKNVVILESSLGINELVLGALYQIQSSIHGKVWIANLTSNFSQRVNK